MAAYPLPIDFNAIRVALVDEVQRVTGLTCIMAEPETQNVPRPPKPYFTMKFIGPALKTGDDAHTWIAGGTTWNSGGARKMTADFNCYARSHEEAYNYGCLWQGALELFGTQTNLRAAGIAVWLCGNLTDLSALLNTGFEGRSHIEVTFGLASNFTEDLGAIETINVGPGSITTDQNNVETFNAQVIAP